MYIKCKQGTQAREIFDKLYTQKKLDPVAWHVLINFYIDSGQFQEAIDCTS